MMVADRGQARDAILALLKAALVAETTLTICYDDTDTQPPAAVTSSWMRVQLKHASGVRATLGATAKHTQTGVLFVELYTPAGDGRRTADRIAGLVADAYTGKTTDQGGISFHDVQAKEIGVDGGWTHTNIDVQFEYDLVR
jgi:hypothetical protein